MLLLRVSTAQKIKELLSQGKNNKEISEILGIRPASVSYHFKRLKQQSQSKKIDWCKVQNFYDEGNSVRQCLDFFKISSSAWMKAVKRGDVKAKSFQKISVNLLLKEDVEVSSARLKEKLLKEGFLKNICSICGQGPTWNGKVLILELDHINGIRRDNRIENLRILCGHCHSQTETFCRGSKRIKKEYFCIDCNMSISKKSIRCRKCSMKRNSKNNK